MDSIEEAKRRMRNKRKGCCSNKDNEGGSKEYVNFLITRILLSVIVFFAAVIFMNSSKLGNNFIKEKVLKENISFTKIANIYNKYFGDIVPFEDVVKDDSTVFNEKIQYESIVNYKEGYELKVKNNYLVPFINSGVVVFVGEKEGLGNTVIVQGIDEVDYWYGNVDNLSVSLYDYVSKGDYLGTAKGDKMYLTFRKGSEYLEFDEVVE